MSMVLLVSVCVGWLLSMNVMGVCLCLVMCMNCVLLFVM